MKFNTRKYDIRNSRVEYALAPEHRLQQKGQPEYICRKCDSGLRPQRWTRPEFHPCESCKAGTNCDKKGAVSSTANQSQPTQQEPSEPMTYAQAVAGNVQRTFAPRTLFQSPPLPHPSSSWFWMTVLGHFAEKTSFQELQNYILVEQGQTLLNLPPPPSSLQNQQQATDGVDPIALHDMPDDHPFRNPFPISTTGDGNCFPRSVSRLVYGNDEHHDEIRVRLVIDAVVNQEQYLQNANLQVGIQGCLPRGNLVNTYLMYSFGAQTHLPGPTAAEDWKRQEMYEHLTFDLSRNNTWCNIWQCHQAANILQRKVRMIFPKWRQQERIIFNREFVPLNEPQHALDGRATPHIMFCKASTKNVVACHFVPVVEQRFAVIVPEVQFPKCKDVLGDTQHPIVIEDSMAEPAMMDVLDDIQLTDAETFAPNVSANRFENIQPVQPKMMDLLCDIEINDPFWFEGAAPVSMDSLDIINIGDQVAKTSVLQTPKRVQFCDQKAAGIKTPASRRKQDTPTQILKSGVKKTPSSRRKQQVPGQLLCSKDKNANTPNRRKQATPQRIAPVRKRIFSESGSLKETTESNLPLMGDIEKSAKRQETLQVEDAQCRLCHNHRKKMKKFDETNYQLSEQMKETILAPKYRVLNNQGEEGICGPCHKALVNGNERPKYWVFFTEKSQQTFKHSEGQCRLCHNYGRRMKKFEETNYQLSERMKETILAPKYLVLDNEGDVVICGPCHKALESGKKRLKQWVYYKETHNHGREKFLESKHEFPDHVCTVCHRLLYSYGVITLNIGKYDLENTTVAKCLAPIIRKKSANGNEYICLTCHRALNLKEPKIPVQAVANNLEVPWQPQELKHLTTLERRCIGLNIPFMSIQSVRQQGKKIKGPCVNVPVTLEPICTLLPRLPEELKTVLVKLKRRLSYDRSYMFDYVRPNVVMRALLWLKAHNPLYRNVVVNHQWFEQLEDVSPENFEIVQDTNAVDSDECASDIEEGAFDKKKKEKLPEIPIKATKTKNGEQECVDDDHNIDEEADFEEEQEAAKQKAQLTVQPSSTCVQLENLEEAVFAIAPGEHSKPKLILTDEQFELVCFPDFFPNGEGGFYCKQRTTDLLMRRYVNQRLLNVDGRFAQNLEYIFSMQYAVELKQLETDRSVYIRNHSYRNNGQEAKLNASMLRNSSFMTQLVSNDQAYQFMRNVRGTPAFWKSKLFDTLAMFNALGKPTWFLTLSAAEHLWPEMIQALGKVEGMTFSVQEVKDMNHAKKSKLLMRNPVTTVRVWKHRFDSFFNDYLRHRNGGPLGKVNDFVVKIEFQARGSPHAHILLWIDGAPVLGIDDDDVVCEFVDRFCVGRILTEWTSAPEDFTLEELKALVERVQMHKHNPMCRASKKHKCRHSFPKIPSFKTIVTRPELHESLTAEEKQNNRQVLSAVSDAIQTDPLQSLADVCKKCGVSEERYTQILLASEATKTIILKREPCDLFVNNYNPDIISAFCSNMDVQMCQNVIQVINYLMSYVTKCEKGMSELMTRIKENFKEKSVQEQMKEMTKAFTGKREVSIQESIYRVLSLPLYQKSKKVVFISGELAAKRDHVPKKKAEIELMKDEEEDVFELNIHDRYEARPDELESMCLVDFGTQYDVATGERKQSQRNSRIELKGGLGWMKKRSEQAVFRTHKAKRGTETFYQHQLKLFFPYRTESELLGGCNSYAEHFAKQIEIVEKNSEKFNQFQEAIDDAFAERARTEHEERRNDWDEVNNIEQGTTQSELTKKLKSEAKKVGKMSPSEYIKKVRTSNPKQKEIVMWCRNHVKKQIRTMKQGQSPEGFKIVLTGPGGTGKSHVISLINHDVIDLFGRTNTIDPNDLFQEGRNPEKPTALLTAMTGTAAFNIRGATLHSVLLLYQNMLPKEKSCVLQSQLHQLQLLTVDEFSMMGAQMLSLVNQRCCFLKQNIKENQVQEQNQRNFGNINILLVGDPYQLPAVRQTPIYRPQPIRKLEDFQEPLWREFKLHELTQIMRQKDHQFASLLTRVRTAAPEPNSEDDNILQSRELTVSFEDSSYPKNVLHVFAQNNAAEVHNEQMLVGITDRELHTCVAIDNVDSVYGNQTPTFPEKANDTGNLLKIFKAKVGARVVLTNNLDVSDGLTNGAYGNITCIVLNKDVNLEPVRAILVQFDSEEVGAAAKAKSRWKQHFPNSVPIFRTEVQFPIRRGKMMHTASRQQFPLFLAWGVTIHKVQGMTMKAIVVDMDPKKGRFQKGQAYVAFSRVTSLEGLHIRNYCLAQIKVEEEIHQEMEEMRKQMIPTLPIPKLPNMDFDFRLAHLNVHGLVLTGNVNKADDFCLDPVLQCVDVLCLSETHLSSSQKLVGTFWEDFYVHRNDRDAKGGGVLIAVKKHIPIKLIEFSETFLEIAGIQLEIHNQTINVFCVYLPPMTNKTLAAVELEMHLGYFCSNFCIVVGDVNEDLCGSEQSKVQQMFSDLGLVQTIREPTTIYGSLLDHLYVNGQHNIFSEVSETYVSDHDIICAGVNFSKK